MLAAETSQNQSDRAKAQLSQPETSIPIWWSPDLELTSLSDLDHRLAKPLDEPLDVRRSTSPEKPFDQQTYEVASVTNCVTLRDLTKRGFNASINPDYKYQLGLAAECNTLELLKTVKPAWVSYLKTFRLDKTAVNILPPRCSVIVSRDDQRKVAAAEAKGLSWQKYEHIGTAEVTKDGQLEVKDADWRVRLTLYARGDFNRDGVDDIVLRKDQWLTEGTYGATSLLVLTRFEEGAILKVIEEIPHE
jgi:hypothetical protein